MRTLIYIRTHSGDPDPKTGVFGNNDCMGRVRDWPFNAVIGIGGLAQEPRDQGIAGKLTWIGIGPQAIDHTARGPQLVFHHFWYRGEKGPRLQTNYPALADRMYRGRVRALMHSPGADPDLDRDVRKILRRAMDSAASDGLAHRGKSSDKSSAHLNQVCR
jgi:hypothetical protein